MNQRLYKLWYNIHPSYFVTLKKSGLPYNPFLTTKDNMCETMEKLWERRDYKCFKNICIIIISQYQYVTNYNFFKLDVMLLRFSLFKVSFANFCTLSHNLIVYYLSLCVSYVDDTLLLWKMSICIWDLFHERGTAYKNHF